MEKTRDFNSSFFSLSNNDYAGLIGFDKVASGDSVLLLKGSLYNTKADILLNEYLSKGLDVFKVVDGDFLIILVEKDKLQFVRDRHGVGPQLFYSDKYFCGNLLDFASLSDFTCKPDIVGLKTFLSIGYIPAPQSSLVGVSKLKAGSVLIYENGLLSVVELFTRDEYMTNAGTSNLSIGEAVAEYERLHKKAINDRIESATKVGLLLSGGYDSGGNISALRDVYQGDVVSYSIGFKDNPWTELPLAKILSERYKSKHYEYEIDGSEILQLPHIISITGDPFQEGGLMVNYTAMQLVQKSGENPDIILGGDGNDQHFGTSGKELAMHWKLKSKGLQSVQQIFDSLGDSCSFFDKDNILFRTEFHNRKILHIQQSDTFGFGLRKLNTMSNDGGKIKELKYLENAQTKYVDFDDFFYCRNFDIDIKQVINEVILYKSSRMSELFGNRISFPYMSTDLYRFLDEMPVNYKFKGTLDELSSGKGVSKYLHKSYLKPNLPTEITDRKKQGGFAPLPIFLKNNEQRKLIFDFIRNSDAIKTLFKIKEINKLLNQYDAVVSTNSYWFWFQQVKANQIINLYTLAVWWEMLLNKKVNARNHSDLI